MDFVMYLIYKNLSGNNRPNVQNSLFSFAYTNKVCASKKTHWTPVKHSTLSEKRTQAGLMARRFVVYMMLLLGGYLLGQGSAASTDSSAQPLKYPAGDIHALTAFDLSIQKLPPNAAGSPLPEASLGLRAACNEFQDIILLETSRTELPCVRNGKTGEMPGWYASSVLASLRFSRAPPVV